MSTRAEVSRDTLQAAASTAQSELLTLAWAFEDYGRPDVKNAVMDVRKSLIAATGPQAVRKQ